MPTPESDLSLSEAVQKLTSKGAVLVKTNNCIKDKASGFFEEVWYLLREVDGDNLFIPITPMPDDEVIDSSILRSYCLRLRLDPADVFDWTFIL